MLSAKAKWDAGCSVIVAARIGDVVARIEPEAQERVSPAQYSIDSPHLRTDEGVQSASQVAFSVSFHSHEAHCGILVGWKITVQKAPMLVNREIIGSHWLPAHTAFTILPQSAIPNS